MASAAQADVQFEPKITVGVVHTDNLTLASGNEEPQTVYELIPAFKFAQQSPRVTSDANYRVEGYRYREFGANEVYHIVDGNLRFALDPDNFFLDVGASRDQTIRDPAAPVATSLLPITNNRLDRDETHFGPAFTYQLGDTITADGRFRRTRLRYDQSQFGTTAPDVSLDTTTVSFDNYRKEQGFTWAIRYSSDKTDYEAFPSYEYRQATVELGSWLGQRVRVFAAGGKESPWDTPFNAGLADGFWEVGFATRDDQRVTAELATGERSFGTSRRGRLGIKFGHGSVVLEHADAPSTQRFDPYYAGPQILGGTSIGSPGAGVVPAPGFVGIGEPGNLLDVLSRPASAERFRLQSSHATVVFDLQRTTLSVSAFDEAREDRIELDGTSLPAQTQTGVRMSASRRLGPRTNLVLAIENSRGNLSATDRLVLKAASLSANYDVSPRTTLSLAYSYASEKADQIGSGFNYTARNVSLLMTRTFARALRNK